MGTNRGFGYKSFLERLREADVKVFLLQVTTITNNVKSKGRSYRYIRKRINIPSDITKLLNDNYVVVMSRRDFIKFLKVLAETVGCEVDRDVLKEFLSV